MSASWPRISKHIDKVAEAINECGRGSYAEIEV
jgi:hypothetical protein